MVNRGNSASSSQQNWILDTGAMNHITGDFNNLSISSEYNGIDRLSVGNGEELSIHNTGASLLKTPTHHFFLNDVLHVPSINQNLSSVSCLVQVIIVQSLVLTTNFL